MCYVLFMAIILLFAGCAVNRTPPITRIALLAPFEGRYREVGYQALYAARMAIAETGRIDLELLAIDDGGSVETAIDRAAALNNDPLVAVVLVMGPHPTDEQVTSILEKPALLVGEWVDEEITALAERDEPFTCGSVCLLPSFSLLADDSTLVTIEVTAPPVDPDFREQYINFDQFVPEPLPIALQSYDAAQHAITIINGENAPVDFASDTYTYTYTPDGELTLVE
ncbi:MAG: hypothetical protein AAFU54_12965 [Chloroflexota bacterium]